MTTSPERGWRVVRTADGSPTALHPVHGHPAHDLAGARAEARARYAGPCGLDRTPRGRTVRLLDVGTGLGLNLAAALEATRFAGARLAAVGLEVDPRVCALAAELPPDGDPGFERAWAPVRRALGRAAAGDAGPHDLGAGDWLVLSLADATDRLAAGAAPGPFDAVFLDGFAPGVAPELWQPAFLRALAGRLSPSGRVATYTASARVRAGLLAAGLDLALPPHAGRKGAGTVAGHALAGDSRLRPLAARQLAKLSRRAGRLAGPPEAGKRVGAGVDSPIIETASCVARMAESTGLVRRPSEA